MSSVLITGASKGIGRAMALELSNRGHRVIATARRPETLADLPVDQGLRLDVTDQETVDQPVKGADDAVEQPEPALRVPVGAPAERALQARKEAPENEPFLTTEISW
ncbi:SDR family NAD(P)-dependent oxidoreductase [Streptomyces sp. NPDC050534]|uniref:SDR family NAD(P)-dependent oxidoreductase n=1 Tax=Streptomyces sp. NPDC050534 TaxID=3365625 RepID=UPI0037BD6056